jgi:predicted nucleotidyltransferase
MAQREIIDIVKHYVQTIQAAGVPVAKAILFGSFAHGTADAESDIDILIVSPAFDNGNRAATDLLWELRAVTDPHIEPVACGQVQWETDQGNWLLDLARNEGLVIVDG